MIRQLVLFASRHSGFSLCWFSWSGFWIWGARWVLVLVWFWFWSDSAEPVPPTDPRHTGFWRVCECRCWMVGEH